MLTVIGVRDGDGRLQGLMAQLQPGHAAPGAVAPAGAGGPAGDRLRSRLTEIDMRILEGIAAGASTSQLARRLHLSHQGVTYHITAMFRQLQVPNRMALVAKAYAIGLFTAGSWPLGWRCRRRPVDGVRRDLHRGFPVTSCRAPVSAAMWIGGCRRVGHVVVRRAGCGCPLCDRFGQCT